MKRSRAAVAVAEARPEAVYVDVPGYVCPTRACRTEVDGIELRGDGIHYRNAGARHVAAWVLAQLRSPGGR